MNQSRMAVKDLHWCPRWNLKSSAWEGCRVLHQPNHRYLQQTVRWAAFGSLTTLEEEWRPQDHSWADVFRGVCGICAFEVVECRQPYWRKVIWRDTLLRLTGRQRQLLRLYPCLCLDDQVWWERTFLNPKSPGLQWWVVRREPKPTMASGVQDSETAERTCVERIPWTGSCLLKSLL